MAYRLRMAAEVRLWLHDLRAADPDEARLVGEAVTALTAAGPGLGPPLVTTVAAARPALSPLTELDRSYQRQLEFLQRVRRGVADVATSRKRIDLQVSQLETSAARLERQRADALEDGSQELAQQTGARLQAVGSQLAALRESLAAVGAQIRSAAGLEAELAAAGRELAAASAGSRDSDAGPAELLELRPGAARGSDLRLLFAIDPAGRVVPAGRGRSGTGPAGAPA